MFNNLYPKFSRGRILKTEMLDLLRDYPRDFIDLYYRDYGDGIIAGAEIKVQSERLIVSPGIVLYQGRIYMMKESVSLDYGVTNREAAVKIRFLEEDSGSDLITYCTAIVLEEQTGAVVPELELGRFKLKEGARLRQDYQSFSDMATEYNTLNILNVPYAAPGKSTLSPAILQSFASSMLQSGSDDPRDFYFAMMCLNEGVLARDAIQHYIAARMDADIPSLTNEQMHKYLGRILAGARGRRGRTPMQAGGKQRVIVD